MILTKDDIDRWLDSQGDAFHAPGLSNILDTLEALREERDQALGLLLWLQAQFWPNDSGYNRALVADHAEQWQTIRRLLNEWVAERGSSGEDTDTVSG